MVPLLSINLKEQDRVIDNFRKQGIRTYNMDVLKAGMTTYMRERKADEESEAPVMCSGCKVFLQKATRPITNLFALVLAQI